MKSRKKQERQVSKREFIKRNEHVFVMWHLILKEIEAEAVSMDDRNKDHKKGGEDD